MADRQQHDDCESSDCRELQLDRQDVEIERQLRDELDDEEPHGLESDRYLRARMAAKSIHATGIHGRPLAGCELCKELARREVSR